jgi:hypothetical protein
LTSTRCEPSLPRSARFTEVRTIRRGWLAKYFDCPRRAREHVGAARLLLAREQGQGREGFLPRGVGTLKGVVCAVDHPRPRFRKEEL